LRMLLERQEPETQGAVVGKSHCVARAGAGEQFVRRLVRPDRLPGVHAVPVAFAPVEAVEIGSGPVPRLPLEIIADRNEQQTLGYHPLPPEMFEQTPPLINARSQQPGIEQLLLRPARLQLVKPRASSLTGGEAVAEDNRLRLFQPDVVILQQAEIV